MTGGAPAEGLISPTDIVSIELFILKRMKEFALGNHASRFKGSGLDFAGLRDWEPGDRPAAIDWAQSTLTNFNPIVSREFEQDSTATIVAVADRSRSTRCGVRQALIATAIARAVATVGLSAALFQDMFGLITFADGFRPLGVVRPRVGRAHAMHCLDVYEHGERTESARAPAAWTATIAGQLRRPSLVLMMSDFLFADAAAAIGSLSTLNAVHDVCLLMIDARFAFDLPHVSAGWVEIRDAETGRTRVLSRREFSQLASRVEEWQQEVSQFARAAKLDIVRLDPRPGATERGLVEFVAERRLRKA
jgi:uncharacterized protein (DUF58 family)